jgi:toxin-antitoxin system PIN domain toxin
VILVDANLLLYAYNRGAPQHERARAWLEDVFSRPEPVRLSWIAVLAFLRIATDARVFARPMSPAEASAAVSAWLALPHVAFLEPGERHWPILEGLLTTAQARGALVMDAHLAALAIEHGTVLCTTDRDFSRFAELRAMNPLENG